jgi:TRAP-type C4-dicarboxylate transport system permease small subunit
MEKAVEWVVPVIIGVMVANIAIGVFFRYTLSIGLPWTEELGRYLMVWAGLLGAALAMKEDSHVGITAIVNLFSPVPRRFVMLLARLVILVFLALIFFKSFAYLDSLSIQKSSAMEIPMVIPYLSVIVGVVLMSVENLALMLRLFVKADGSKDAK